MKMLLTAQLVSYLEGTITLHGLVSWAEEQIAQGFAADALETQMVYRLGVADAENFELSWEELATMLKQLGYKVRLQLQPA